MLYDTESRSLLAAERADLLRSQMGGARAVRRPGRHRLSAWLLSAGHGGRQAGRSRDPVSLLPRRTGC